MSRVHSINQEKRNKQKNMLLKRLYIDRTQRFCDTENEN